MKRRRFLAAGAAAALGGCRLGAGLVNPCLDAALPTSLARHELVAAALEGLDPARLLDTHVHLLGIGDSGSGAWVNPRLESPLHPWAHMRMLVFANAACVADREAFDRGYVARLLALAGALPVGARLLLLAFDYAYDRRGRRLERLSDFAVPDAWAARLAAAHPDRLLWAASIHPYRDDAADALERAARAGARAVKWLPAAQGIDPASPRCDRFYAALARLGIPLISHAGAERAVAGVDFQDLGNPLRLRRALDHGVDVICAHCASMGEDRDLDRAPLRARRPGFELFARMMDEPGRPGRLYGDLSALTQANRVGPALAAVLERRDWHDRLLNGSDYPLPGVWPLYDLGLLVDRGYLDRAATPVLGEIRAHNPLLFDLVLKRSLRRGSARLPAGVFEGGRLLRA